jgi:hypothetical protein
MMAPTLPREPQLMIIDAEVVSFDRGATFEVALTVRDVESGHETRRMCSPTWRDRGPAGAYASAVKRGTRKAEIFYA